MPGMNRITELTGEMAPIFTDPQREYCYLSRVQRYRRIGGGARFSVLTNDDREMTFDVRFGSPYVVRVRCHRPGEEPPTDSAMLVDGTLRHENVHVEAREGRVVMRSDALELRVVRRPFHYGVFDLKGRKLLVQQIGDVTDSRLVSLPLGCSRDLRGRIAFHESFELAPDERLYSSELGTSDLRGRRIVSRPGDAGGAGAARSSFSFIWSSLGYGVFVNHGGETVYELGCPSSITCSFRVEDAHLDYSIVFGADAKEITARYVGICDRGAASR
jgi:hypothetical protein